MKIRIIGLLFIFLILECLALISLPPHKLASLKDHYDLKASYISQKNLKGQPAAPSWWEISIRLKASGSYTIKEGKEPIRGVYSFILLWTGCMEQDMEDYLIYHETSRLLKWEAQEKAESFGKIKLLSEKDFSGKPHFDFHYILRKGKELHFDFQVESFYIPQNQQQYEFYLYLPASEENKMYPSKFNYNDYIIKGSNRIFVVEKEIYNHQIDKTYQWSWKYQKWLKGPGNTVFLSNNHQVQVNLLVIPHSAAR